MAFSSSKVGMEKGFGERLRRERAEQKIADEHAAREAHRRKSSAAGVQHVLRALRRMRSQQLWLGFAKWRDYIVREKVLDVRAGMSEEDQRLAEIGDRLFEVRRIVQETRLSNAVAAGKRTQRRVGAEAAAAAEIANRPTNALAILQERLASMFSGSAIKTNRLRRLANLVNASARGDADRVCEILDDSKNDPGGEFDLNMQNDAGLCALVVATVNGSLNVLKSLLKRGANLELRDESGASPLIISVKQRAWTMCCELLSHGADVSARDRAGDSALAMVVRLEAGKRERRLLRLLLQYGADPCLPDATFNTPIHVSTSRPERIELLQILLEESKAGVLDEQSLCDCRTSRGETPLLTAARFGTFEHVSMLIDACWRQDQDQDQVLEEAASASGFVSGTVVIKPKIRLWNVQDVHGETPLHAAAMRNETNMVKLLLDCGASIRLKTETRDTALDLAKLLNCNDVVHMLTAAEAVYQARKSKKREQSEERKKGGEKNTKLHQYVL
jgi:ankyrin repeat protein